MAIGKPSEQEEEYFARQEYERLKKLAEAERAKLQQQERDALVRRMPCAARSAEPAWCLCGTGGSRWTSARGATGSGWTAGSWSDWRQTRRDFWVV